MQNVVQLQPARARQFQIDTHRYATCIEASRRVRWDIEEVFRGRTFDLSKKFLPDALSRVGELDFLDADQQRLLSQVQGRTYANMIGLFERSIGTKMIELGREHSLGNQVALEALVRFTEEELKHQELFRRIELMIASAMPAGYAFQARPNDFAWIVLGKTSWGALAMTCMIELFTQAHYRYSIASDSQVSGLYRDVFLFHWKEELQHAVLDELEWRREDARLTPKERDDGVHDVIALIGIIDGMLQRQAYADAEYFSVLLPRPLYREERNALYATLLRAYRLQYIFSGADDERFGALVAELATPEQGKRFSSVVDALR